jgi:hypothetical protein
MNIENSNNIKINKLAENFSGIQNDLKKEGESKSLNTKNTKNSGSRILFILFLVVFMKPVKFIKIIINRIQIFYSG